MILMVMLNYIEMKKSYVSLVKAKYESTMVVLKELATKVDILMIRRSKFSSNMRFL